MGILKFIFVLMVLVPFAIYLFYFLDKMLDILPKKSEHQKDEFYSKDELKERRRKNKKHHKEKTRRSGEHGGYDDYRDSDPIMSKKELKERVREEKRIEKEEKKAARHAKKSRSGRGESQPQYHEQGAQSSNLRSANAGYHRPEGARRSLQEEVKQASYERHRQSYNQDAGYGQGRSTGSSQSRQRSRSSSSGGYVSPSAYASARSTESKLRESSSGTSSRSRSRSSGRRSSKKRKSKGRVNRQQ